MSAIDYKPNDPAVLADPFPLYARLRDEDPAHWSPRLKAWVLTRYEDVKRVCLDSTMSSDRLRPFFATLPPAEATKVAELARYLTLWMVFRDPPEHTRLRRLAAKVFHVRSINALRPNIERLTHWLLDALDGRKEFDFISDFAMPLPALVIMDMLGAPREELARLKRLSDEMALFIGSARDAPEKYERAGAATREMADLFRELISARRATPQRDLLSELVALDDGGDRLSDDELVATCILLLFAGHETTTHHLANGLRALLRFPGELEKLRANPALAPAAVEELLRYDGPIGAQVRIVQEPHTLHGKALKPGERVFLLMNAANRDPRAYDEPDRVDLSRNGVPHLTFGFGAHICLGFPLARLEGQVALPAVLARWRRVGGLSAEPDHLPRRLWWVLAALTLTWGFNWTALKVALSEVPPWTFRSLCLGLGSLVLFAALRAGGQRLAWPTGQWRRLWLLALLNITSWNMLVAFGVGMIPSGRAAILAYTMPVWAVPLSVWLLGERITGAKLLGLALGLGGLALLLGESFVSLGAAPLGSLLVLGASMSWALGTVMQKRFPVNLPVGAYTAWIMLLGGVPIFIGALAFEDVRELAHVGLMPALGTLYNVFIAFAFAHWAWIKIATSVPVSVFSIAMLLIPVVGVLCGMLFLGERPTWAEYAALGLVLAALLTVLRPGRGVRR